MTGDFPKVGIKNPPSQMWCVRAISHSTCTTYIRVHIGKIVVEMADVVTLIMISTSDSRLMVTAIVMSVSSSSCQCVRIMIAAF